MGLNDFTSSNAQAVLMGALLISPQYAADVLPELAIDQFHPDLQPAFAAVSGFWETQGRLDMTEICTRYPALKEVLLACVESCSNECVRITKEQVERWAQLVQKRAALERFQVLAMQAVDANTAYEDLPALFEQMGEALSLKTDKADFTSLSVGLDDYVRHLNDKPEYIRTGLSKLDQYLHLVPGNFFVIGGRPSAGKTALSLQIAVAMAKTGRRVCYFSLETDPATLTARIIANQLSVPLSAVKNKTVSPAELDRMATIKKLPLFIRSASGKSVGWIKAQALRMKADVVVVDYLQLIPAHGAKDRYTAVTQISMALHELAQGNGLLVVALAQLNRQAEAAGNPTNADLRESGQVEQDADAIVLLAPETNDKTYFFSLSKNKEGECHRLPIRFEKLTQRFVVDEAMSG